MYCLMLEHCRISTRTLQSKILNQNIFTLNAFQVKNSNNFFFFRSKHYYTIWNIASNKLLAKKTMEKYSIKHQAHHFIMSKYCSIVKIFLLIIVCFAYFI